MPQVQLAANFFKKEREQAYTNPPLAVWRELFQNSVDQDVTQIDVTLVADPTDQFVTLTFSDNGPGMTRQVLHDVYFNIGNSTKDHDPTKIGGMGRARILTCFAMQSYRILSQDYEVVGRGGYYEVTDHAWTPGCRLIIEVDGYSLTTMTEAFDRFLRESRITARLLLNGQRVFNRSLNPGRHVRNLEANGQTFARVWVNKSVKSQRVVVRVNGVSMFTHSTNANAQVMVELDAGTSRQVLTANRDGLRSDYRAALERFLNELAVDTTSAVRSRFGRRTTVARGGGMKIVRQTVRVPVKKGVISAPVETLTPNNEQIAAFGAALQAAYEPMQVDDSFDEVEQFDTWLRRTFGDIYVFDEAEESAIRKALPAYNPASWQVSYKHIRGTSRPYRKGGNIIRLLLMWQTAVNYAIEIALKSLGKDEILFTVGFLFADDKQADHRSQDGGHVFSLRPVNSKGKLDFALSNRRDLKRLMTCAKHEVTHINISWHSENFSTLRETIDVEFDDGECLRRMKDALRQVKNI